MGEREIRMTFTWPEVVALSRAVICALGENGWEPLSERQTLEDLRTGFGMLVIDGYGSI